MCHAFQAAAILFSLAVPNEHISKSSDGLKFVDLGWSGCSPEFGVAAACPMSRLH